MNGATLLNFIPGPRRELTSRRARLQGWAVAAAAYALLLALAYAACAAIAVGEDRSVVQKLGELPAEIDRSQRALTSSQAQLADAQARLDAARVVAQQPDWSVLLGLLAQTLGDEIVLTSCRLDAQGSASGDGSTSINGVSANPRTGPTARSSSPATGGRFTLQISGLGRSQWAVSQFVLRLEQIGLFERVTILKTSREMLGEQEGIGFRLEATVGPAASEGGSAK